MSLSTAQVRVRNLSVGGDFVGEVLSVSNPNDSNYLGITAFVPFTIPGETVEVQINEKKDRYLKSSLLSVIESSENRVEAECSYYGDCGGCELQHIRYDIQLKIKYQMIQGALKAGKIPLSTIELLKSLYPSDAFHYRRRIHLHLDSNGRLGFYKNKTRTVISINSCPISVPEIDSLISSIHSITPEIKGKVSSIFLESDGRNVIALLSSPYMLSLKEQKEVFDSAKKIFKNFIISAEGKEISGSGLNFLELPLNRSESLHLKVPAGSFSQVNWGINVPLIERVLTYCGVLTNKNVLDLYSGAGNFSLPLAHAGANVTAVETDPRLVFFGKESAKKAGLEKRLKHIESSVEVFLKKNRNISSDITILDPPRSGVGNLYSQVAFSKKIILISCHLPSFVRDLKNFISLGYSVTAIEPFDMFAQTSYVEVLAVLERS